jgi:hypothetical protein
MPDARTRPSLALLAAALMLPGAGAPVTGGAGLPGPLGDPCSATFDPRALTAGTDSVSILASFTSPVGPVVDVHAEPASGLVVLGAARAGPEYHKVQLLLDATRAAPGRWTLHFRGTGGSCVGDLAVRPSRRPPTATETP